MSDLLSLRMVAIGPEALRQVLRRGAAKASLPILLEDGPGADGIDRMLRTPADAILVCGSLPAADRTAIVGRAGACEARPLVVVLTPPGQAAPSPVGEAPDGSAPTPQDDSEAARLLEACAKLRVPNRVLVVDDSATMRSIVRKILSTSRFAFHVEEVDRGEDAVTRIGAAHFDYILLDYHMPGLSGTELLAHISAQQSSAKVIVISSTPDAAVADRTRQAGAAAFLRKPFYPSDIEAILFRLSGIEPAPSRAV